ncbi:MAG: hypothetical protein KKD28_01285 [Chloroflexi bacterium]|nr:hypothetical protein [Chloroflexota bacterium]
MARKPTIPNEVRTEVERIVVEFNSKNLAKRGAGYSVRFRGNYTYVDRGEYGSPSPICRLTYNGAMDNWGFAIYKYSNESYDPEEWFFPGAGEVDGTVEGAMRAGLMAYPI